MHLKKVNACESIFKIIKQYTNIGCCYGAKSHSLNIFYNIDFLPEEWL